MPQEAKKREGGCGRGAVAGKRRAGGREDDTSTNLMLSPKQDTPLKMSDSAATAADCLSAARCAALLAVRFGHLLIMIYILPYSAAARPRPRPRPTRAKR